MTDTLMVLSPMGLPLYSARGLTETLEPIQEAADLVRLANGDLDDWSFPAFKKFALTVACTDQRVPAIDGIWPGQSVTVQCVSELAYPSGGSPERTPVTGSSRTENGYVFYRPVLSMRLMSLSVQTDEWGAAIGWSAKFEEV